MRYTYPLNDLLLGRLPSSLYPVLVDGELVELFADEECTIPLDATDLDDAPITSTPVVDGTVSRFKGADESTALVYGRCNDVVLPLSPLIDASVGGGGPVAWASITGKPTTFTPSAHAHAIGDVTGLQSALDGKAASVHLHTASQVSDFVEAAQDAVAAMLGAGSNITLNYDDGANTLTVTAVGDGTGLDPEAVRDAIGVAMVGVGLISVTVNDALDTITLSTTATANATDAALRDRSTHTGSQAISTVTGLQGALDSKAPMRPAINAQTGTTFVVADADEGTRVTLNNAAAITVTLPASVAIGVSVDFHVIGAGMATFVQSGGATVLATPSAVTRAQGSAATAVKLTSTLWHVVGDLA